MYTNFRPKIRSRHPSHDELRKKGVLPLFPFRSVIRFGSVTDFPDTVTNGGNRIEINTIQSIKNSSSKLEMKRCFAENNIKTADWWTVNENNEFLYKNGVVEEENISIGIQELPYPIISKHVFGSRGTGNKKHDNAEQLQEWLSNKKASLNKYIFEKFYSYNREYRLHVTKDGCFYTCRKVLKQDTPQENRWFRNDENSNWLLEENESFDKPVNWDKIVEESVNSLKAVGLDVGAVDLRIQSAKNNEGKERKNPEYIVVEINSAPSFGEITLQKYINELSKLLINKSNEK